MTDPLQIVTPDGTFNCLVEGEGEPLLLLHGLGTSLELWREAITELEPRFQVVAPDTLSHGSSSRPRTLFTISHHAESMFRLLDTLGLTRVAIAGNSMGAQIALEMAATQPHRVSRVISVACPAWGTETERLNYLTMRSAMFGADGMQRLAGEPDLSGSVPESDSAASGRPRGELGIWYLNSLWAVATYDVVPRLPQITSPALVVYGSDDWLLPTASTLLRGLRDVEQETIQDGGHLVPRLKLKELAHSINRFVAEGVATS